MKDYNRVLLMGRLGVDPVQRETKNGNIVVHFPLATKRRVKLYDNNNNNELGGIGEISNSEDTRELGDAVGADQTHETHEANAAGSIRRNRFAKITNATDRGNSQYSQYTEETQWHKIVVWGRNAEACSKYIKKGDAVFVEGSIRSHQYEGKNGEVRTAFEVYADEVSFLGRSKKDAAVDPDLMSA